MFWIVPRLGRRVTARMKLQHPSDIGVGFICYPIYVIQFKLITQL